MQLFGAPKTDSKKYNPKDHPLNARLCSLA